MTTEFKNQSPQKDEQTTTQVNEPQFVSNEQLEKQLMAFADKINEKINNDIRAQMGRVSGFIDEKIGAVKTQQVAPKEGGKNDPAEEVRNLLAKERAELAKERELVNKAKIRTNLENLLLSNNANPSTVKLVTDSLMLRNADKFKINTNELGESTINYVANEYEQPVLINDFVKSFLLSPEGQSIQVPKKAPANNVPGGKGPITGDIIECTSAEAHKMDPKLLMSGRVKIVD